VRLTRTHEHRYINKISGKAATKEENDNNINNTVVFEKTYGENSDEKLKKTLINTRLALIIASSLFTAFLHSTKLPVLMFTHSFTSKIKRFDQ